MKNLFNRHLNIYGLLLLILISGTAFSAQDRSKKINKSYQLKKDTEVRISNQFGLVNIETRENSTFEIEVDISVQAKSEKQVENLLNSIDIEFGDNISRGYLEIETHIDDNNNKGSFSIAYNVIMPVDNQLSTLR